ncbi:MAG: MBL fold metallo-hydrolase [Gemmatimonadota bacterium]|mgnify:CR=1 FL=1
MTWARVVVLAALLFGAADARAQRASADSVRLVFFDVGQGDAALVITPNGKHILIDAGPSGANVAALLDAYDVKTLDLVVASHNHADHIGGMPEVFAAMNVLEYVDNGVPALTQAYRRLVDAVENENGLRFRQPTARDFRAGGVIVRVLRPWEQDRSQNNNSVGIWLQFGSFNVLFGGDAERPQLGYWLLNYHLPPVSVLKASHHGSFNGVSEPWAIRLEPRLVVVSVGAGNQYDHPDPRVMEAWTSINSRVYRTDSVGTITVSAAEGGGFSVRTTKGSVPWVSK